MGRPLSFMITPRDLDGAPCAVGDGPLAPQTACRPSLRRNKPARLVARAPRKGSNPAKSKAQASHAYDPKAYRGRNLIEPTFCHLKDSTHLHAPRQTGRCLLSHHPLGSCPHMVDQLSSDPSLARSEISKLCTTKRVCLHRRSARSLTSLASLQSQSSARANDDHERSG